MKIEWNRVTWYSKLGAAILLIGILPAWTFYIGVQYENTLQILNDNASHPAWPLKSVMAKTSAGQPALTTISGWATYKNDKYGFSFQYPSDWSLSEATVVNEKDHASVTSPERKKFLSQLSNREGMTDEDFSVTYCGDINSSCVTEGDWMGKKAYKSIPDLLSDSSDQYIAKNNTMPMMHVGGLQGYGVTRIGGFGGDENYEVLVDNGGIYSINFYPPATSTSMSDLTPIQRQILSTFKFLRSSDI